MLSRLKLVIATRIYVSGGSWMDSRIYFNDCVYSAYSDILQSMYNSSIRTALLLLNVLIHMHLATITMDAEIIINRKQIRTNGKSILKTLFLVVAFREMKIFERRRQYERNLNDRQREQSKY